MLYANEPSAYFSFKSLFCTDWTVDLNWYILFTKSSLSETAIYNKIWFLLHYSNLFQYLYLIYVKWSYIAWACRRVCGMLEISKSPFQIILTDLRIVELLCVYNTCEKHVSLVCLSLLYNLRDTAYEKEMCLTQVYRSMFCNHISKFILNYFSRKKLEK